MNIRWISMLVMSAVTFSTLNIARAADNSTSPVISHTPVKWGVKGQPLTLKARVSGGVGGIENVTLYYALFRDAAPFRVTMATSGMDLFVGTIEAGLLTGVSSISYYIEAQDKEGTLEETPWYDVAFKDPDPATAKRTGTGAVAPTGGTAEEESSAMTLGLIAGGAAAIAVGAYVISDSGGSSDSSGGGGGGGDDAGEKAGTYNGSATTCLTFPPGSPSCSNSNFQILVDPNGKVVSDTLVPGQQMVGSLSGNTFSLQADTSNEADNFTGTIVFNGSFINNNQIIGSMGGSANLNGTAGSYSGSFNASK